MQTYDNIVKKLDIAGLLILFFNLNKIDNDKVIFSYKTSGKTIHFTDTIDNIENINKKLTKYSKLNFEINTKNKLSARLKLLLNKKMLNNNDTNTTVDMLVNDLYRKIVDKLSSLNKSDYIPKILVAAFGLRGSVDISANFFTLDINRSVQTKNYVKKIYYILNEIDDTNQLNINYREFQKDFQKGKERNTQLRINLSYFVNIDKILSELKKINYWKYNIITHNIEKINKKTITTKRKDIFDTISKYNFLWDKNDASEYNENELEEMKKDFFNKSNNTINKQTRKNNIVQMAKVKLKNFCFGCIDHMELKNRSFLTKSSNEYYLEINHVIPFSNGQTDVFENLVKLCPPCHKALTPNRAQKKEQIRIISSMLLHRDTASKFIENFINSPYTIDKKIDYVYKNLK